MLNIAICNDNIEDINVLEKIITKYFGEYLSSADLYVYKNLEILLRAKNDFNIIILDILLNDKNGLHEAFHVHKKYPKANIIFYSIEISFAPESYGCGFIAKPATKKLVYTI